MIGRLFGAAIFVIAAIYLNAALPYEVSFGDPLGPRAFPLMLAVPALLGSASLVAFPGTAQDFASGSRLLVQAGAVLCLFAFVFLLPRLGFLVATAGMVAALAMLMQTRPAAAIALGGVAAPALWLLFDRALDLPLPLLGNWIG